MLGKLDKLNLVKEKYNQPCVQQPPFGPEKSGRLIKVRFRLVVDESNWLLLTGGRCSEMGFKACLTLLSTQLSQVIRFKMVLYQLGLTIRYKILCKSHSINSQTWL